MPNGATSNMRFLFKGVEVDERTREYVSKRLESIGKMTENILQTEVEIGVDKKGKFRVEVMVRTPRDLFRAENTTESIEGSTDLVVDEIQDQIAHLKDKLLTLQKRGGRSIKKKTVIDENARF
ncbi:MAG TPA: ribosome-associated translation inhibitor RaiA [Candidatus Moranbacteria bacterium]|nr:ribosome-associated translation inhibitor RaiA [Candidatus Moranbacteria bacterium]